MRNRDLTAFLFVLIVAFMDASAWEGDVTAVPECDRLVVSRDGRNREIRVLGADCPEKGQEFFKISKRYTTLLVQAQRVRVEDETSGSDGAVTARVLLPGGGDLGHALIRSGMAWWDRVHEPDDSGLAVLERSAREKYLGLWSDEGAIAPWEFRISAAREAPQASQVEAAGMAEAPEGTSSLEIIFRSPADTRFHRRGCPHLGASAAGTVSEAVAAGLSPCPRCFPPRVGMSATAEPPPR